MKEKIKKRKTIFLIYNLFFLFFIFYFLFLSMEAVLAQGIVQEKKGIFSDIPCFKTGEDYKDCDLCDILYGYLKLANWGLNVMGIIALFLFVVGGVIWLTSGGSRNQIESGKRILTGTLTGIIIMLSAYLIVNLIITALTGQEGRFYIKGGGLKKWYEVCEIKVKK